MPREACLEEAVVDGSCPCRRIRSDQADRKGSRAELAEAAGQFIEAHYTEKFSLEEIAGALFVNKSYLLRVFKESTGKTLLAYHNQVRCGHAKELLHKQELKISQVGSRVGYSSASHFTRVFHGIYGITPSEYRARHLHNPEG